MTYRVEHQPNLPSARKAAHCALKAAAESGRRPVLVVPDYSAVLHERRFLADAGMGFGVAVETMRTWPEDLWFLYGTGASIIDSDSRLLMLWKLMAENQTLLTTPGTANLLASCAQTAMPLIRRVPQLSVNEAAAVDVLLEYRDQLSARNLIEQSQVLDQLAQSPALSMYQPVMLGIDEENLSPAQQTFLNACEAVLIADDATAPADTERSDELTRMLQIIFRRDAQTPPVQPTGAVRLALAAGPSAATSLTVDAVAQLARDFPGGPLIVAAKDPSKLFEGASKRLQAQGLSCSLCAHIPFEQTDAGRALFNLADLIVADRPDVYKACDYSIDPLSGASRASAFRTARTHRRNRLISKDDVLSDLASNGGETLMGAIDLFEEQDYSAAFDLIQKYLDKRFAQRPAYRAVESAALSAARSMLEATKSTDTPFNQALSLLQGRTITATYGQPDAVVRFMKLRDAASLEPSSVAAVLLCDLNASDYPVKAPADATLTLLDKLDAATHPDPLAQARVIFFRALQTARERIVLQRCLNDVEADEAPAATMFTEVIDCYRASITDTAGFHPVLPIPQSLADFTLQAGEEDILRNVIGVDCFPIKESTQVPPLGEISDETRSLIVLPQIFGGVYAEGISLSPSQIEAYLECPYQWFAKKRLKLESLDEGFGPMERGSFVHRVLEYFLKQLWQDGTGKVTAANLDTCRKALDAAFERASVHDDTDEKAGHRYAPITPWEKRQRDELLPQLQDYLETEAALLPGFTPTYFEWNYGETTPFRYAGCNIRGQVDRIDVDGNGHAVVIDYKTSISSDYRLHDKDAVEFTLPRKMQALIYSKVVEDLLHLQVVGALYVNPLQGQVRGAWDSHFIGPADIPFDKPIEATCGRIPYADVDGFSALLARSEDVVKQRIDMLAQGMLEPDSLSDKVCKYCPVLLCPDRKEG